MGDLATVLRLPPIFQGVVQDLRQLLAYNSGVALFPAYAAYPPLVDYFLGTVWKAEAPKQPLTANPSFFTMARLRLSEPRIYRRLLGILYIVVYQFVIIRMFAINNGIGNLATKSAFWRNGLPGMLFYWLFGTLQGFLCAALWVILPSRATPFSAIGSCALGSYVVYLGFLEPITLVVFGNSLKFVNSPYHPHIEVFLLGILAVTTLVGASFNFGLSSPFSLPSWASKVSSLGGLLPTLTSVRFPILNFPAGKFAFVLAWVALLAIPTVLTVPVEMRYIVGHKLQKHYNDARNPNMRGSPLDKTPKAAPKSQLLGKSGKPHAQGHESMTIPAIAASSKVMAQSFLDQPQVSYMGLNALVRSEL
jgi:hypothetical protein